MKATLLSTATLLLLAGSAPVRAQSPCNCTASFDSVVSEVERNYSGYATKVTDANRATYREGIAAARSQAVNAANPLECQRAIRQYIAFFKDRHVSINYIGPNLNVGPADPAQIRTQFGDWRRYPVSEAEIRRRLATGKHDPIEGIWSSPGQPEYRIAMFRDATFAGDTLVGVILKADSIYWVPGQVKILLAPNDSGWVARYFMRDHSEQTGPVTVARNVLRVGNVVDWVRTWPETPDMLTPDSYIQTLNSGFRVDSVDPHTLIVHIPSFDNSYAATVDSLFAANGEKLRHTENLIIDLRGNGGGNDYNYRHLLPLIYTKPMISKGIAWYATRDNIRRVQQIVDDPKFPAGQRAEVNALLDSLRHHVGEFTPQPDETTKFDSVLPLPRKVAVIMDRGCASACEQFILTARQSSKVTLYGENTAGVLDFANVVSARLPCSDLLLSYATSRSSRLPNDPVDPMGIGPQVRIPHGEIFPLDFVTRRLESN